MDTTENPILAGKRARAIALLDHFSVFTDYRHGKDNPYLKLLYPKIQVRKFLLFCL